MEKSHKIDKHLEKIIKSQRDNTQINKIWNEKGGLITETEEIIRK